jgi:PadR family transcriptional regulator, regulatory protein AphA
MNYKIIERNDKKYIKYDSAENQLSSEQDALDFIAACFENNANFLMLHSQVLSDDFFRLRTGLAGHVLQKFINYHIKVAVILTDEQKIKGKFKEFIAESNKGNDFRVFNSVEEAESWLLN